MPAERIILGIDPGTVVMGYGIILQKGNALELLAQGVLKLHKHQEHALRIKKIFDRTLSLIDTYHPDELAIEAQFHGKNVQSMLKLGRAQGVAIAAALSREIPYTEYAPRKIKQALTGKGNASKEQVAGMVQRLLRMPELPETLDATDSLATALCHSFQRREASQASYSGWKAFLAQNPGRKRS